MESYIGATVVQQSRLSRLKQFVQSDLTALPDEFLAPKRSDIVVNAELKSLGSKHDVVSVKASVGDEKELNIMPAPAVDNPQPINATEADAEQRNLPHVSSDAEECEARSAPEFVLPPNRNADLELAPEHSGTNICPEKRQTLYPNLGLHRGQLAPADPAFCPILTVSKFPYVHVGQTDSERVADIFFNTGKFWTRTWELFYIWSLDNSKVVVLVSEEQFTQLLKEIDNTFHDLDLLSEKERYWDIGLIIQFEEHPRLRPRYLGVSRSRNDYDKMISTAPDPTFTIDGEKKGAAADDRSLEAFRHTFEECIEQHKQKSKRTKATKKAERIAHQQFIGRQLKRSQRYLGLRPKFSQVDDSPAGSSHPTLPITNDQELPAIDIEKPVPYAFEKQPVFMAIDVEAYELNHNIITEVGITTLDTLDLVNAPPGKDGANWFAKARRRHFRIEENKHIVNSQHIQGCPDRFEFGESEFVRLADAPALLASCFREPFSREQAREELEISFAARMEIIESLKNAPPKPKRTIILVGHSPDGDIRYLQKLGFNPLNTSNVLEVLDAATLYRVYRREQLPVSLGTMLYNFDMVGWNLHNAGNDAAYTLQAFLAIVVRDASRRGDVKLSEEYKQRSQTQLKERLSDAVDIHEAEQQGFEADIEDDGGEPYSSKPFAQNQKQGMSQSTAGAEGPGPESSISNSDGEDPTQGLRTSFRGGRGRNGRSFNARITHGSHRHPPEWPSRQPTWIIDKDGLVIPNPAIYDEVMGISKKNQVPGSATDNKSASTQGNTPVAKEDITVDAKNNTVKPTEDLMEFDSATHTN